jgi:hypothetical protein
MLVLRIALTEIDVLALLLLLAASLEVVFELALQKSS